LKRLQLQSARLGDVLNPVCPARKQWLAYGRMSGLGQSGPLAGELSSMSGRA